MPTCSRCPQKFIDEDGYGAVCRSCFRKAMGFPPRSNDGGEITKPKTPRVGQHYVISVELCVDCGHQMLIEEPVGAPKVVRRCVSCESTPPLANLKSEGKSSS